MMAIRIMEKALMEIPGGIILMRAIGFGVEVSNNSKGMLQKSAEELGNTGQTYYIQSAS